MNVSATGSRRCIDTKCSRNCVDEEGAREGGETVAVVVGENLCKQRANVTNDRDNVTSR